jgi:hypothetical protein
MNRTFTLIFAVAIAIVILPLAGCGDNGTGPANTDPLMKPKAGSTYVLRHVRYDTTGAPLKTRVDTMTIVATGLTFGGATDVMVMVSSEDSDSAYMRYAPSGDLIWFEPVDVDHDGRADTYEPYTYPVASRARIENSIDTFHASGTYDVVRDSIYYETAESVTVPVGTFQTSRVVQLRDIRIFTDAGVPTRRVRELASHYFAPSIGFFTKIVYEHDHLDNAGKSFSRYVTSTLELISYELK